MRTPAIVAPALLLAACTGTAPVAPPSPLPAVHAAGTCSTAGLERFRGAAANVDVAAEMLRQSGARTFRWTGPGLAVTMDYREDRLNVELDPTLSRIVRASCG